MEETASLRSDECSLGDDEGPGSARTLGVILGHQRSRDMTSFSAKTGQGGHDNSVLQSRFADLDWGEKLLQRHWGETEV